MNEKHTVNKFVEAQRLNKHNASTDHCFCVINEIELDEEKKKKTHKETVIWNKNQMEYSVFPEH